MTCNEGQPPTPHRIELCPDETKAKAGAPKAKKRLNSCQDKQNNHKVTEYFPVRRSVRKTKKTVLEEKQRSLEQLLRSETEEGLEVRIFEDKGRGVVAAKPFAKGDFVVEYSGDLIDLTEAKRREHKYAQDLSAGCYMYYFRHNNQQYCVDATAESGRLGRLVNHSRSGNLITRTVSVDGKPRLVLIAKDDIKEGDEITYDYGDRSKESLKHHPWLAY
ncbi:histone-lysine N-methyltransferase pr-set7 [Asbolus verrucosus]|uniref:[histone H4]-lysine(20) N-methyltransferase n=1 Tax=Asbolus verrucosus TaxID=1661398 RepID=A0A482VXA5_ASBVE|nr:histone-lysine N-methyltransferase pr-set7 [Asbolus verrucosus]